MDIQGGSFYNVSQAKKFYFDHGLAWMSMDVQGHQSMDIHVLLNGIMVKDHGLTDHGQSPWSVKTWSSPWTLTMVIVHGCPCFVKWHHGQR